MYDEMGVTILALARARQYTSVSASLNRSTAPSRNRSAAWLRVHDLALDRPDAMLVAGEGCMPRVLSENIIVGGRPSSACL